MFRSWFLQSLHCLRETIPPSSTSRNMRADRYFLRDSELAAKVFARIPAHVKQRLRLSGCCSDLRFIHYPLGGFIAPHRDGIRVDTETGRSTSVSFLLYLSSVPEGEGGETTILDRLPEQCTADESPRELLRVQPIKGSLLLFPHDTPHQGEAVGEFPKVLLRGDLY
mmetsp:Transcript_28236/g.72282  ORF Transcript_28236/g.72282 Transcript_28236/m.72282 type:complete len:167 (+) Transcript_28236:107-607(+)